MKEGRVFAADLGASGGKCFVGIFENEAFRLEELHRFYHEPVSYFIYDSRGEIKERKYWDEVYLYSNILRGLNKYRREISDTLDSIGIDTWGSDGQFVTDEGDILGRVYCYRDHRLDTMIETMKNYIDPEKVYSITGIQFQPFNISNQLLWFIQNRKNLLKTGYTFLPMPSLFYFSLGNVKMVDSTWASVTQLMDTRKRKWSPELLEALGVPEAVMPEIVSPGTVVGKLLAPLAEFLRINRASLTAVPSHDTASAYAAAPVEKGEDTLIISSGTWSLVGKLLDKPITSQAAMAANISNEGGINCIRFLKNCMGTWPIQELRRNWRDEDGVEMSWEEIVKLVRSAEAFKAFIDPDDSSFYNPPNMEEAVIAYCRKTGQKPPKDRKTFLRVVYESLALKYRMVNEQICSVSNTRSTAIHIVGGGCKNELLNRFTADAVGIPVIAGPDEATAIGNIMVQAAGLGIIQSLEESFPLIRENFTIKRYEPENTRLWEAAYRKFTHILRVNSQGKGVQDISE